MHPEPPFDPDQSGVYIFLPMSRQGRKRDLKGRFRSRKRPFTPHAKPLSFSTPPRISLRTDPPRSPEPDLDAPRDPGVSGPPPPGLIDPTVIYRKPDMVNGRSGYAIICAPARTY